jgi:hypothetical protein
MHPQIDLTKKLFWSDRDEKYYEAWKTMKAIKASSDGKHNEELVSEICLHIIKKTNKNIR